MHGQSDCELDSVRKLAGAVSLSWSDARGWAVRDGEFADPDLDFTVPSRRD